jgi:hypothetical protein
MHSLSLDEIERFASRRGVNKSAVKDFLSTVGLAGTEENALLNLYYDARLYDWNISTVETIKAGISLAFTDDRRRRHTEISSIDTPLPSSSYHKPKNCIACGKPASSGSYCSYCQEMREELRCWPKNERVLSG